ncbi:hypothetical protein N7535_000753 [Penicillium sp. DV-2018c]|nr:hypothetical protein N7535_000753 [Penicillium sp. DV-2018c]
MFTVLERVGRLAYRLNFDTDSRVHPVVGVAHLEPAPAGEDPCGLWSATSDSSHRCILSISVIRQAANEVYRQVNSDPL